MRYTLYGQGEGLSASANTAYVTVDEERIIDVSISALKAGIRVGWPLRAALSVLPNLQVFPHPKLPSDAMKQAIQTLWRRSPFLQVKEGNDFFLQLPSEHPPISEVRELLLQMERNLGVEQRFRVGLGENPFLAQALVAWSRIEKIPDALYLRVGRQQFLVPPGISKNFRKNPQSEIGWIENMPISALWYLSTSVKTSLQNLGIVRLKHLTSVSERLLVDHFGKEARLWRQVHEQKPNQSIEVNYPPVERSVTWRAPIGEEIPLDTLDILLDSMSARLADELQKVSAGAVLMGIRWETDFGRGKFEHIAKSPIHQPTALIAQLHPGRLKIEGTRLHALAIYVSDLRPLQSIQSEFLLHNDAFYPTLPATIARSRFTDVWKQLIHKFPTQVKLGAKPTFREQRMAAIQELSEG